MHAKLLADPEDPELWAAFLALDEDQRATTVEALKEALDKLVRVSPAEALELADLLFRAALATPSRLALGHRGRAVARHVNDRGDEALEDYRQAIELYAAEGAVLEVARIERALIDLHHLAGRNAEAFACAERARATFERLGEERQLAQLDVNVGNVLFRQDQLAEAEAAYSAAAERFGQLGDETGRGIAEYNRGNVQVFAGRYEAAAQAYLAAGEVFEAGGMHAHVAECDYARAWMLSMRCRFADAIVGLEAARARFEETGRRSRAPLCDLDLAELYLRLDARWDAIEYATRAAEAFRELGLDHELAKALGVRGLAQMRVGAVEAAATDLEAAATIQERLGNRTQGHVLGLQRAAAELAAGGGVAALEDLWRAHRELAGGANALFRGVSTVTLARALTASGDPGAAETLLAPLTSGRAAPGSEGPRGALDILLEVDAWRGLAEAQRASANDSGALASLEHAVERIEATLSSVPGSDARTAFFRDRHGAFVELARLLAEDGRARAGLGALERGRAREATRDSGAGNSAAALQRERLDALLLRRLDADLGALTGNAEAASTGPSDAELLEAERSLARELREHGLGRAPATLEEAQLAAAVGPGEVALCYLVDPSGVGVFVVTPRAGAGEDLGHTIEWQPLAAEPAELLALGERLELALGKRLAGRRSAAREARDLAVIEALLARLGELLVAPVSEHLAAAERLLVVPYGSLHGLPFHALQLAGEPLALGLEVSYAPGLIPLAASRGERSSDGVQAASARVLLAAQRDDALPAIAAEAQALAVIHAEDLLEVEPAQLLATLGEARAMVGGLHLAAHGAFQPHNPLFSGLTLGEHVLTAHDVRQLALDLALVSLSGCETGRTQRLEGEALIGIDQAFLAAGARAVVSSLWVVDDQVAERLMVALHRRVAAGLPVGRALAEVQREALASSRHPFDWAPFVLLGDPSAVLPR